MRITGVQVFAHRARPDPGMRDPNRVLAAGGRLILVTSLPFLVKLILAVGLIVSIGLAFFGRGPTRPASRRLVVAVAGGGLVGYLVGLHAAISGRHAFAAALIAVAGETMCLAVWLCQARSDGDGGAPPPHEPRPAGPRGGPRAGSGDLARPRARLAGGGGGAGLEVWGL